MLPGTYSGLESEHLALGKLQHLGGFGSRQVYKRSFDHSQSYQLVLLEQGLCSNHIVSITCPLGNCRPPVKTDIILVALPYDTIAVASHHTTDHSA